jgi:hypothetical protein
MLSVIYAEYRYAEFHYAKCHYAECRGAPGDMFEIFQKNVSSTKLTSVLSAKEFSLTFLLR